MKRRNTSPSSWVIFAASVGFLAGMLVMAALYVIFPAGPLATAEPPVEAASGSRNRSAPPVEIRPSPKETPPPVETPPPAMGAVISANPVEDLRDRQLTLPVQGARKDDLRDSFNELRGSTRKHEALDLLAPRYTPVIAVEDGTVARLFYSEAGGITIYQFDPSTSYVYYYAHLDRYADGLKEGAPVRRGQVLGYVGTSGNAPKTTPHLHFAIFKLTDKKQWWQGTAIDPYSVLK